MDVKDVLKRKYKKSEDADILAKLGEKDLRDVEREVLEKIAKKRKLEIPEIKEEKKEEASTDKELIKQVKKILKDSKKSGYTSILSAVESMNEGSDVTKLSDSQLGEVVNLFNNYPAGEKEEKMAKKETAKKEDEKVDKKVTKKNDKKSETTKVDKKADKKTDKKVDKKDTKGGNVTIDAFTSEGDDKFKIDSKVEFEVGGEKVTGEIKRFYIEGKTKKEKCRIKGGGKTHFKTAKQLTLVTGETAAPKSDEKADKATDKKVDKKSDKKKKK